MRQQTSKTDELGPTEADLGHEIPPEYAKRILQALYAEHSAGRLTIHRRILMPGFCVDFPTALLEGGRYVGERISLQAWALACLASLRRTEREELARGQWN